MMLSIELDPSMSIRLAGQLQPAVSGFQNAR